MLNTHIEIDLNNHVTVISSYIISEISAKGKYVIFETLLRDFMKKYKECSPDQFMDAFTFLFMLGVVDIVDFKVVTKNV